MKTKTSVRLSKFINPTKYSISLRPDFESFLFEGEETIQLDIAKPTQSITLHSKDLEITSVEFEHEKNDVWALKVKYDEKNETVTFTFPKKLQKGKGLLKLSFRGTLNDKMRGFYRSKYMVGTEEKYLATTQFEATDARRAFPCFDEPDKKAVFEVTLKVPSHHEAISNTMPIGSEEHESGIKVIKFSPTPKMSTYLLAFISGEFEQVKAYTKNKTLVRVLVTPGKKHQADFALKTSVKILEFYESYFGIRYPLPSLDMIAIPDFFAGAMENWGAVTYRETALLVDPEHTSSNTKQWVAMVIAHELAHQWFGNLVTMEWWTHLWLNEGFASYIEYLAVDKLFPDWNMWTQFAVIDYAAAIHKDALANTHPIEVEVHHPDDIGEIFDDISYRKGASVIHMLASFLGEKDFRDGLRLYLKTHSYSNAKTTDLWRAFEKVSHKPVEKMMKVWTTKPGYPLVEVEFKEKSAKLSQKRFFANPANEKKIKDKTTWPIPIGYLEGRTQKVLLLNKRQQDLKLKSGAPVKLNAGEWGFYRVNYKDSGSLNLFKEKVIKGELSELDRLGLVSNIWTLVSSGHISSSDALSFSRAFKDETEYNVWLEVLSNISYLYRVFYNDKEIKSGLEKYTRELTYKIISLVGWKVLKTDNHNKKLLRSLVLGLSGSMGNRDVILKSKDIFKTQSSSRSGIPVDLRGFVYVHLAENGGETEYNKLLKLYRSTEMSEEKNRLGRALVSFKQKNLLEKALKFSLSSEVRTQDALRFNTGASINPCGAEVNWQFMKKNWKRYLEIYGHGGHLLSQLVDTLSRVKDPKIAKDIAIFFKKNPAPGAQMTVKQVLEHIETSTLLLKRDKASLQMFFRENS